MIVKKRELVNPKPVNSQTSPLYTASMDLGIASFVRGWIAKQKKPPLRLIERLLLLIFLFSRFCLFVITFGRPAGFDTGAHLEMLQKLTWGHPDLPIRETFYSYHPPMGFLLARSFHLLGLSPEVSIQIVSALFGLATFFLLRQTLQYLKILHRPASIVFLYVAASVPLQIFIVSGMNLESILLACAAAVLYCGIRLFWGTDPLTKNVKKHPWRCAACGVLAISILAFALLTKFSGILLLTIPPLVAALSPLDRRWWKAVLISIALSFFAGAISFPYYYVRYYVTEGTFFPNNGDWIVTDAFKEARKKRDENPVRFFTNFFDAAPVHLEKGILHRDYDVLRFADTWRDLWLKDQFLGPTNGAAKGAGILYLWVFPMLILAGLPTFLLELKWHSVWTRLGIVLFTFGLLQFAAFLWYLYSEPFAGWGPAKGLYVAPLIWAIAFLAGALFGEGKLPPWRRWALFTLLAVFVFFNHTAPAYA